MPIVLLFIGAIFSTIGDVFMKKWVLIKSPLLFVLGLICYLMGLVFLSFTYHYKNITVATLTFLILNILIFSLINWIYFKESLTKSQIGGIILGIITLAILESV